MDLGILSGDPSSTRPNFASGVFAFAPENDSDDDDDSEMEINLAKFASGTAAGRQHPPPTSGFAHVPVTIIQKNLIASKSLKTINCSQSTA